MNIAMLKPGESARVTELVCASSLRCRLMDMGLVRGELVVVEKVAPLGDPIEVIVKGYRLSLRIKEARSICVERTV
jgi:Fe2+ transport system protein FeoA